MFPYTEYPKYCQSYKKDVNQWNQRLIFENYCIRIGLFNEMLEKRDMLLLANKSLEKILDSWKAKEHYQLFTGK